MTTPENPSSQDPQSQSRSPRRRARARSRSRPRTRCGSCTSSRASTSRAIRPRSPPSRRHSTAAAGAAGRPAVAAAERVRPAAAGRIRPGAAAHVRAATAAAGLRSAAPVRPAARLRLSPPPAPPRRLRRRRAVRRDRSAARDAAVRDVVAARRRVADRQPPRAHRRLAHRRRVLRLGQRPAGDRLGDLVVGLVWAVYNAYLAGKTGQSTGKRLAGIRLARYRTGRSWARRTGFCGFS